MINVITEQSMSLSPDRSPPPRFRRLAGFALALSLTLAGSSAGAQQAGSKGAPDSGVGSPESALMPGDAIRLAGSRETELPGDYPVDETGNVVLPILGSRTVSGIPASQLKRTLVAEYHQRLRNQDVQVALLRRVRVLGAVKNPGLYLVDPTMRVADAIALAGGAAPEGKLKGVQVLRAGQVIRTKVDADTQLTGGLQSGDQVMVPERSWFARNGQYVIGGAITALGIVLSQVVTK